MIYLFGMLLAILCVCGWLIWYLKEHDEITLTVVIIGIGAIIFSWISVMMFLIIFIVYGLMWLGENGDDIVIWRKPKEK